MAHHVSRFASRQTAAAPVRSSGGGARTARVEPARKPMARGSLQGLRIGAANNLLEADAERIANQVMRGPLGASSPVDPGRPVRSGGALDGLGHASGVLGSGRPLPESERAFFEPRFSWSFANVRIHDEPRASQAAASMSARAFTLGNHVAFAHGEWRPGTADGRRLLAHELAHVQQAQKGADPGEIRRALNFEMQVRENKIYAWDPHESKARPLPRKFGPGDYLVKDPSGLRLESETGGQLEFETRWESDWAKIEPQIVRAQEMARQMHKAPKVHGSYRKFPFDISHLRVGNWEVPKGKDPRDFADNSNEKSQPDKALAHDIELVVREKDENWTAYFQTSESFRLNQFKSFFEEYESNNIDLSSRRKKKKREDATQVISAVVMRAARVALAKVLAKVKQAKGDVGAGAQGPHTNLLNFLAMVISYVQRGQYPVFSPAGRPTKYAFSTMSKTHFGSIFQTLSPDEQALFVALVEDADELLLKESRLTKDKPFFVHGQGTSFNPTIGAWLDSIAKGKDILSSQDSPGKVSKSMGRRLLNEEIGNEEGLITYEVRVRKEGVGAGSASQDPAEKVNEIPVDGWLTYAKARFESAFQNRNRDDKTRLSMPKK